MNDSPADTPKTLSYRGHRGRRPVRWRRLVAMILISVSVILLYEYSSDAIIEARFLYYQRQWAHSTMPPDQVVFDTQSKYSAPPDPITRQKISPMIGTMSSARRSFPQIPHNTWMRCNSGLLLHSLRGAHGTEWIVCVDVAGFDITNPDHTTDRVMELEFGSLPPSWQPPRMISTSSMNWYIECPATSRLRFFAGQTDPSDSSHFTIRYDFDGSPGVIEGYLQDNGTIRIVPDRGTGGGSNPRAGWRPIAPSH